MCKEILYKAKYKGWRELPKEKWWVEGFIWGAIGGTFIIPGGFGICYDYKTGVMTAKAIEVDPKTLCQYTGKTDTTGRKIFENDIVGFEDCASTENGYSEHSCAGQVGWDDEELSYYVTNRLSAESWEVLQECTVLGNIFDDPELLTEYL